MGSSNGAAELGITTSSMAARGPGRPGLPLETQGRLRSLLEEGKTVEEVAVLLNIGTGTVYRFGRRFGVKIKGRQQTVVAAPAAPAKPSGRARKKAAPVAASTPASEGETVTVDPTKGSFTITPAQVEEQAAKEKVDLGDINKPVGKWMKLGVKITIDPLTEDDFKTIGMITVAAAQRGLSVPAYLSYLANAVRVVENPTSVK